MTGNYVVFVNISNRILRVSLVLTRKLAVYQKSPGSVQPDRRSTTAGNPEITFPDLLVHLVVVLCDVGPKPLDLQI